MRYKTYEGWLESRRGDTMNKSISDLLDERTKTHGPFNLQAQATQDIKRVFKKYQKDILTKDEYAEALDMIAHKLARIIIGHANFKDHWDDIAGYAKLGSQACEKGIK